MENHFFVGINKHFGYLLKIISLSMVVFFCMGSMLFVEAATSASLGTSGSVTIVIDTTLRHNTSSPSDTTFYYKIVGKKSGYSDSVYYYQVEMKRGNSYWYGTTTISGFDGTYKYTVSEIKSQLDRNYDLSTTHSSRTVDNVTIITYKFVNSLSSNSSTGSFNDNPNYNNTSGVPSIAALLGKDTNGGYSGSPVTSSSVFALETAARSASGATVAIRVTNAGSISPAIMQDLNNTAAQFGKTALLYSDTTTLDGTVVQGCLYVEPAKFTRRTSDLLLGVYVDSARTADVVEAFNKAYSNKIAVISLDQKSSLGARLKVAAKLDLGNMNTATLQFYSYSRSSGTCVRILNPEYGIDENGYLQFYTDQGGEIIVTDSPLAK